MSKVKQPIKQRNFVAKYNKHRSVVMRDRTKYNRKYKHGKEMYEYRNESSVANA